MKALKLCLATIALAVITLAAPARGGSSSFSSSRSYSSSSSTSRSYSSPSSSRSYSYSAPRSQSSSASTPSSKSYNSQSFSKGFSSNTPSSKTYSLPRTPTSRGPVYANRIYGYGPSYHYYYGVGPSYYNSFGYYGGGGIPWYAWFMIMHQSQTQVIQGATGNVEAEPTTEYNYLGMFIWLGILGVSGYLVYRYFNKPRTVIHRYY